MRRIRRDQRGVESLPLRLMIVAIVASMSVIPAAEVLEGMRAKDFLRKAEVQLEMVVTAVQSLHLQGPGAVMTIELDFSSEGRTRYSSLALGDVPGGPNASVVYVMLTSGAVLSRESDGTGAQVSGYDDTTLTTSAVRFGLRLEHVLDEFGPRVRAEVIPWTS